MKQLYLAAKTFLLTCLCLLFYNQSFAVNYTAVSSGNFSVGSTWQGNNIPPATLAPGDKISIPNGINVSLDRNVMLNVAATLDVDGTLSGGIGYVLSISQGTLSGGGTVSVDSLSCSTTTGLTFTGSYSINTWYTTNAMLGSGAKVTVKKTLILAGGTMTLASGTMDISSGCTIVVNSGSLVNTGGTADLSATYNIIYSGPNVNAGIELKGGGLNNIEIAMSGSSEVSLTDDLTVTGTLTLTSGSLKLNGNSLRLTAGSDVAATGSGSISSDASSNIQVSTSGSLTGELRFPSGKNTVGDLTINTGDSSSVVKIGSELNVNNKLELMSGRLHIGNNQLRAGSATISGGGDKSFVLTEDGGKLSMNINGGTSKTYHVGARGMYAPCIINSKAGSVNTTMSVSMRGDVKSAGETGVTIAAHQPVVDATWVVESASSTGVEYELEAMWYTSIEVNSFNRAKAYISNYTGGAWDSDAVAAASNAPYNMYKISRAGLKTFGAFAVFDDQTAAGINTIDKDKQGLSIYPNPVTNQLHLNFNTADAGVIELYNVAGQLVKKEKVQGTTATMAVWDIKPGLYFLYLKNDGVVYSKQFMKL